jgi:macrolide-specific efflux system membrane fusion protein
MLENQGDARRMGKVLKILVLVLAVAAGFFFLRGTALLHGGAGEGGVNIAEVRKGDIEITVTAQGKLEPKDYVDVGAQVSGQIKKLHVDIGSIVKKGDLIAEIDPKVYQSQVEGDEARIKTLQAQIIEQKAEIKQAEQKLSRNQTLIRTQAISQEALEDTQTALDIARAQLLSLDAQLEEAQSTLTGNKASLGYTKIYAPMDGTVVDQQTKEGQTINASQTAPVIVQVANLDVMTVRAQVAEADVGKLTPDMPVYFTTLGAQGRRWQGVIRQILPTPETVNDVVLYNVLVDVDNKDRQLMTGMTTQIFFVQGSVQGVPLLPVAALGKRAPEADDGQNKGYVVHVLDGKTPREKTIAVGLMDRTQAQVVSGLAPGDRVLLPSAQPVAAPASSTTAPRRMGGMGRL